MKLKHPKPRVYLETTVISLLTSRPNRDIILFAHQELTRDWWRDAKPQFEVFVSEVVVKEASAGDREAASARLATLDGIPRLEATDDAIALAKKLIAALRLPERAHADAFHIAIAAVHGMDYLLSWNCTHIANAKLSALARSVCTIAGHTPPIICTPEELPEA